MKERTNFEHERTWNRKQFLRDFDDGRPLPTKKKKRNQHETSNIFMHLLYARTVNEIQWYKWKMQSKMLNAMKIRKRKRK